MCQPVDQSSFSKDSNSCVEVRLTDSAVCVRDSKSVCG
ncbi:DUF397 domain-containing protein [Nocardia transvalensis]